MRITGIVFLLLGFAFHGAASTHAFFGDTWRLGVLLLDKTQLLPQPSLDCALVALLALLALWYWRERRLEKQRSVHSKLYSLGEQMTAGQPAAEGLQMLRSVLPGALDVTEVRLYLYDRGSGILRRLVEGGIPDPVPLLTEDPVGLRERAVASCFRNRSLLVIPDTRRSPFFQGDAAPEPPRSAMFVPMFAQSDLAGVLEVDHARKARHFSQEEQAVVQHLANQFAIGMRLRERQSIQKQLIRSEKPAAARLISRVTSELKEPLAAIADSAEKLRQGAGREAGDLSAIAAEARKASRIVTRLLSLTNMEHAEPPLVDVSVLLKRVFETREPYWREKQVRLEGDLPGEPILVESARQRLELVILSLLAHAEVRSFASPERSIRIVAARSGGNALVRIDFSAAPPDGREPLLDEECEAAGGILSLQDCDDFLSSCGGQLRVTAGPGSTGRFEVLLPAAELIGQTIVSPGAAGGSIRKLIALLVDPDSEVRRGLLTLLGDLGHRAVAAGSAEEAADLAQRFHFQAVFCAVHLPSMNCLEFYDCVRGRVDAFVLLSEEYDSGLAPALPDGVAYVLNKPIEREALRTVLATIESRLPAGTS